VNIDFKIYQKGLSKISYRHIKAVGFQATTVVKAMLTEIGSYLPK